MQLLAHARGTGFPEALHGKKTAFDACVLKTGDLPGSGEREIRLLIRARVEIQIDGALLS